MSGVLDSGDDGFSADGSQIGHVPDGLRFDVRGPLSPGLVRPVAVVVDQVLAEHQGKVALAEDQGHKVRSSNSLTCCRVPSVPGNAASVPLGE